MQKVDIYKRERYAACYVMHSIAFSVCDAAKYS